MTEEVYCQLQNLATKEEPNLESQAFAYSYYEKKLREAKSAENLEDPSAQTALVRAYNSLIRAKFRIIQSQLIKHSSPDYSLIGKPYEEMDALCAEMSRIVKHDSEADQARTMMDDCRLEIRLATMKYLIGACDAGKNDAKMLESALGMLYHSIFARRPHVVNGSPENHINFLRLSKKKYDLTGKDKHPAILEEMKTCIEDFYETPSFKGLSPEVQKDFKDYEAFYTSKTKLLSEHSPLHQQTLAKDALKKGGVTADFTPQSSKAKKRPLPDSDRKKSRPKVRTRTQLEKRDKKRSALHGAFQFDSERSDPNQFFSPKTDKVRRIVTIKKREQMSM